MKFDVAMLDPQDEISDETASSSLVHITNKNMIDRIETLSNKPRTIVIPPTVITYRATQQEFKIFQLVNSIQRQQEERWRRNVIELTEAELVVHLLNLLNPCRSCPFLVLLPSGGFEIDDKYCIYDGYFKKPIEYYVMPFVESHRQINSLVCFAERKGLKSVLARFLQEFVLEFFSTYTRKLNRLYGRDDLTLPTLLHVTYEDTLALSTVYDALSTVMVENLWCYKSVNRFLNHLFCLNIYSRCRPAIVGETLQSLQSSVFQLLGQYFDHLFTEDRVDVIYDKDFIFYSDELSMLKARSGRSIFWTNELVSKIFIAATNAYHLRSAPIKFEKIPQFSSLLMQNLEKYQNGKFILWHDINFCFEITCDKIIKHTSAIFYEALSMNHTLPLILHELQIVFNGSAAQAAITQNICDISMHNVRFNSDVFYDRLKLFGFSEDRCNSWTVSCVDDLLCNLKIIPQLPWPYEFVIDLCLINTLNQCLKFFLKLIVARESLCDFYQRNFISVRSKSSRKWCLLITLLNQPLTIISEIFSSQLQSIMAKKTALCLLSSSVEELCNQFQLLNSQLSGLISNSGIRSLLHQIVDKLCLMVEDISMIEDIEAFNVDMLLKIIIRERNLLIGLGRSMCGTIFHPLCYCLS